MYREMALADLVTIPRDEAAARDAVAYQSKFGSWDTRASVRAKPRRLLDSAGSRLYYPPELLPIVSHPLITAQGEALRHRLLVQQLFGYLHFTTELEELAVIPIVSKISRGRSGLVLPEQMREDAYKIATDEAWHAQFSYDLIRQVESETGVRRCIPELPAFVGRLDRVRSMLPAEVRGAEGLMFSIVSETLISSILADLPRDRRLPTAVRELVRDHAEDEGRHHAYFRSLLRIFWSSLSGRQRRQIGPHFPAAIRAFLEPDLRALAGSLSNAGLSAEAAEQVLSESYPQEATTRTIAASAATTVRYLVDLGALKDPRTAEAFALAGLSDISEGEASA
ncbi:diiron oxygenase [Micromonospora aurantiaca]|uniref:diiron oxygenase n=1 Tax=Micromonospora aurantiaca (nom. illeg.) TaxID=47850 RepID=UPI0034555753